MHKSNEDCFYFLTSSCAKGSSCTYRHSPLALTCNVICPAWLRGNCLDPACVFRHSTIQRPMVNNGILCFYENTPNGCLKPECTFIHSRPRMNLRNTQGIRPALTNPMKNDITKPATNGTPSTTIPQLQQTSESSLSSLQSIKNETTPTNISSNSDTSSPIVKNETVVRRIAISPDTELSNETKDSLTNNTTKSTTRSVIADSPKMNPEETTPQTRLIVNRNVVIGESTNNVPTRTIVQSAPSSNRVVVASNSINSPSKGKKNNNDSIEEKIQTKKFKSATDVPSPSSTSSIVNRLLKPTSINDTRPVRLDRQRLPAKQTSSGNSSPSVSTPSNEEKTSAGTELAPDNERRTMRLERFQKKPTSPTRLVTSSIPTRNVITPPSPNERKRTIPEITMKDLPPSKRVSTSSPNILTNSSSSARNNNLEKQTNELIVINAQEKNLPSPERPRFTPQLITGPSSQPSSTSKASRPRQPSPVVIKRPLVPVTVPSPTSTKPTVQISPAPEHLPSHTLNEEDENQLLKLNESADIVDTFALIDEALLEADHLLELM